MRLSIIKSKNSKNYYIIDDIIVNRKRITVLLERLGNEEEVLKKSNGENLRSDRKENLEPLIHNVLDPNKQLEPDNNSSVKNGGYLFIEKIFNELKLDNKYSYQSIIKALKSYNF